MKKYNIAVVPLDGIGKELHPYGVEVLKKAEKIVGGFELEFQWYEAGVEYAFKTGKGMPDNFYEEMCAADAMYCGSCGHFDVGMAKTDYPEYRIGGIWNFFRTGMGNVIGLRPLTLLPGVPTPLANPKKIDIYLVRELSEGCYVTKGSEISDEAAYDVQVVTRETTEKLARYAFEVAKNRQGRLLDNKKMVTLATKDGASGILSFYRKIFSEIAPEYEGQVELQYLEIDALCDHMIKAPERFDVIVCENMHGDIVSDIGACITGGMGVTPTADVGGITPHFRPNHGTFPRAVGKGFANPIATIMTAWLMLDTLANSNNDNALKAGAKLIRDAVEYNLAHGGPRTRDLGGNAGTDEAAKGILEAMDKVTRIIK